MSDTDKLQWVFEIQDKLTTAAGAMASAVDQLNRHLEHASGATGTHEDQVKKLGDAHEGATGKIKHLFHAMKEGLEFAFFAKEVLGEVWAKVSEIGAEVLHAMKFKQDSLIGLEALTGTRDKAVEMLEQVEDFAWKTGQSVTAVMDTTKNMLSAGMDPGQIRWMQQLLGDMQLVGRPEQAAAVGDLIANAGRRGSISGSQMVRQLRMLAAAGLDTDKVLGAMSRRFGVSAESIKTQSKVAYQAAGVIAAIGDVMNDKFSKGRAGSQLEKQAKTIPALLERIRGVPERMFDELTGASFGAGGTPFAGALENIANAFDPTSPTGMRILDRVRGMLDAIGRAFGLTGGGLFDELAGPNGAAAVEKIFNKVADVFERAVPIVQDLALGLGAIAKAVAWIASVADNPIVKAVFEAGSLPLRAMLKANEKFLDWTGVNTLVSAADSRPAVPPAPGSRRTVNNQVVNNVTVHAANGDPEEIARRVKDHLQSTSADMEQLAQSSAGY